MLKHIILIPILCCILFSFKAYENDFDTTIIKVVKAFNERDASTLNGFIHKDKGLIVLFRRGVFDEYLRTNKIDFERPVPEYLPYLTVSTDYKINFQSLPVFDCDSMVWSKIGLYCDTIKMNHLLSTTAENLKKYREDKIPDTDIDNFIDIENHSRRIVLTDEDEGELIFYLTLINNKWYLTIMDRVSSDCSA